MILGVDSRIAFTVFIAVIAVQRLWELKISKRNQRRLQALGGIETGSRHYPWMVALHTTFLVSCVVEVWVLARPWLPLIGLASMVVVTAALGLRWWALTTLGTRWTTRVVVVPGQPLVTTGPYRWLRHPNYLAVVMEIAAIPMMHCAWMTAAVFSVANLVVLRERIRVEEAALEGAVIPPGPQSGSVK